MNPRDSATDFGGPADTLTRLMLRRGIPYGPPLAGVAAPANRADTSIAGERDFVVPTGDGYFFAPPISAVDGILATAPARSRPDHEVE